MYDLPADKIGTLKQALTFTAPPSQSEIAERAEIIAAIAASEQTAMAMIGGAPYLMGALESCLKAKGIAPVYSFTERQSVETTDDNGNVVKTAVFRHIGFVLV